MFARFLGLGLAFVCTVATATATPEPFTPRWDVGSSWTIQTAFRQMDAGEKTARSPWSALVRIRYKVTDRREENGETRYTILAEPETTGSGFTTTITAATDSAGRLSIRSVSASHRRYGHTVTDRATYGGVPVFTDTSIIPYDAPVFPLARSGRTLHGSSYLDAKREFIRVVAHGGLNFAQRRSQRLNPVLGPSTFVERADPVSFRVAVNAQEVLPVEMEEAGSGQRVHQYWAPGYPWFLYSENNFSRSWLVK